MFEGLLAPRAKLVQLKFVRHRALIFGRVIVVTGTNTTRHTDLITHRSPNFRSHLWRYERGAD